MKNIYITLLLLYIGLSAQNKPIPSDNYQIIEYRDDGLLYKSVNSGVDRIAIKNYKILSNLPSFKGIEVSWINPITDNSILPTFDPFTQRDRREGLTYSYATTLSDGSIVALYEQNTADGWLLRRTDAESGEILWSVTVSKDVGGTRGAPSSIYQSSENTLEVLWHKAISEEPTATYLLSHLARTSIQINDGSILEMVSASESKGGVRFFNLGIPGEIRKQANNNRFLVAELLTSSDIEGNIYIGKMTFTDENGLPDIDSLLIYPSVEDKLGYVFYIGGAEPMSDGGFLVHYAENHRDTEGLLDFYHTAKISATGTLDWTRNVSEWVSSNFDAYPLPDNRFFAAGTLDFDTSIYVADLSPFLSLYDETGNMVWHKIYEEEMENRTLTAANLLNNQEGMLFTTLDRSERRQADIYQSDMEGNLTLLANFELENETSTIQIKDIQELENGDLMLHTYVFTDTTVNGKEIELRRLYALKIDNDALFTDIEPSNTPFSELQVYPNPAREELTVSISDLPANIQNGSIELHNTVGQLLLRVPIEGKETQLKVNELPKGLYLLRVMANKRVWSVKRVLIK